MCCHYFLTCSEILLLQWHMCSAHHIHSPALYRERGSEQHPKNSDAEDVDLNSSHTQKYNSHRCCLVPIPKWHKTRNTSQTGSPWTHRSGSHLAKAACSSSSFLASCILSSAIWACSSAIWSCRSLESPSSFRRVFSNSCLCFSSRRRRSDGDGDTLSYTDDTYSKNIVRAEKIKLFQQ